MDSGGSSVGGGLYCKPNRHTFAYQRHAPADCRIDRNDRAAADENGIAGDQAYPNQTDAYPGVSASQIRGARISFWYPASGELEDEYSAQIAEFNRTNIWGITVEGRAFLSTTQLEDQVNSQTGEPAQPGFGPLEMLLTWQAQSQIVFPLDELIHDPEWGLSSQEIADIFGYFWNEESDGQRWGIPAERNAQVLFYNVSWAQALGFQHPPATEDEFKTQACAAMKANVCGR